MVMMRMVTILLLLLMMVIMIMTMIMIMITMRRRRTMTRRTTTTTMIIQATAMFELPTPLSCLRFLPSSISTNFLRSCASSHLVCLLQAPS